MGSLARPELTEGEEQVLRESMTLEEHKSDPDGRAAVYHVGGFFTELVHDTFGLSARVGDYHAEWIASRFAEKVAEEKYREDHPGEAVGEVYTVSRQRSSGETLTERMDEGTHFWEVAVIAVE